MKTFVLSLCLGIVLFLALSATEPASDAAATDPDGAVTDSDGAVTDSDGAATDSDAATTEAAATIVKIDGLVRILRAGEIRKRSATVGSVLNPGDMLITYTGSNAVLKRAGDSTYLVMDESSKLVIQADHVEQQAGEIYYDVRQQNAVGQLVKTDFATLGVKGTRFIVVVIPVPDEDESTDQDTGDESATTPESDKGKVALDDGELEITSPGEPYEIRGFEDFRAHHLAEFERFKQQQRQEFAEFKQSFSLSAGQSVRFRGLQAVGSKLGDDDQARFSRYRTLLNE